MSKTLSFILNNFEDLISAFFISVTTILVVINIILRYIFNSGLVWSEEVATGCFVWSVFIGAVAVLSIVATLALILSSKKCLRACRRL